MAPEAQKEGEVEGCRRVGGRVWMGCCVVQENECARVE